MRSSKIELKRARPALGTIVMMRLQIDEATADLELVEGVLAKAFDLVERLEEAFSKFREGSDVARLNLASLGREIPVSAAFANLLPLAIRVWRESRGAFDPFLCREFSLDPFRVTTYDHQPYATRFAESAQLDLSGIAKGFVVDEVVDFLSRELPQASGVVNAGGDLRFFNTLERPAEIRLGVTGSTLKLQTLKLNQNSLATSSFEEMRGNPLSSTKYTHPPRLGLNESNSVSVISDTCAIADALTKVGWFAESEDLAASCARTFGAEYLIL